MFFYRRQHAQVTLDSSGVVITDVALNHLPEFLFAGETLAVIAFPFQNAPESFHRSIVNAVSHTGHTLSHSSLYEFVVEGSACVLEMILSILVDTFSSRISLTMPPSPKPHNTACVLS